MCPDNQPDISESYDDIMQRFHNQRAEDEKSAREALAAICDQLAEHGIEVVRIPYDGYGDSGTMENVDAYAGVKRIKLGDKLRERLLDASYDLLPGGWELNEGSFGELIVNVAKRQVTREHNWRSTDYEENTFEL
jgi:hypothetical protein